MKIRIKYLSELLGNSVNPPVYASENAAGMDLCACIESPIELLPDQRFAVPLGFAIEIPVGYAGFIYARSGLGLKKGITLPNCVGVIDSDYRGEVKCALVNISDEPFTINPGDRICQMVIAPVASVEIERADELAETARGAGGFGSTGVK